MKRQCNKHLEVYWKIYWKFGKDVELPEIFTQNQTIMVVLEKKSEGFMPSETVQASGNSSNTCWEI